MSKETVLVIEDEEDIQEVLRYNLEQYGYDVMCSSTGEQGLLAAKNHNPDLVLLDLMLPNMDGIDVCKELKSESNTKHIPIVMLTARNDDSDIIIGLELGADDYITKPFSPKVLMARIKSLLKRLKKQENSNNIISLSGILMDSDKHEVQVDSKNIDLTFSEFKILDLLIKHPERVYSRQQIMNSIKDNEYIITERTIDVQIVGLRKKLGIKGKNIKTVRGIGYKFNE